MRHYTREQWTQVFEHVLGDPLPNQIPQGIHEVSQVQRHRTGARLQIGNRVFHYAHTIGILVPEMCAKGVYGQDTKEHILPAVAALGDMQLLCTISNVDGPSQNGLLPLNHFEGGTVIVIGGGGTPERSFVRGIVSSTAVTINGGTATFTIQLDAPVPGAYTIADIAACLASPYRNIGPSGDTLPILALLAPFIGMPTITTVAGDWTWIQTWGPTRIAPDAGVSIGANNRRVIFTSNGSITDGNDAVYQHITQIAGHAMANEVDGTQGCPFVYLMIDP